MNINEYDSKSGYCRMLGHHVSFSYCRIAKENLPCFKIIDCWFEQIPVKDYLNTHFTGEEKLHFLAPPQNKVTTLLDLINQSKSRLQKS